jgi:DHA2 family multidrug resistance protein
MLTDSVNVYSANTNAYTNGLASIGLSGDSLTAQLNQVVTAQAYMMATNDFFRISCAAFLVLAVLVWVTKPRKGVGASMGH